MRRLSQQASVRLVSATAARSIYTQWGSVVHEDGVNEASKMTWLQRITSQSSFRSFYFWHVPQVAVPAGVTMSSSEQYLLSVLEDDLKRLLAVEWCFDFDSFWKDRVASHSRLFTALYVPNSAGMLKFLVGNASANAAGRCENEKRLNKLQSALKWALETERVYSMISLERFHMQRHVFDAFEREKILGATVAAIEEFKSKVPAEFRRKATAELDTYLANMRHWIWDCPNAKREFPRQLA
jgi:hypothetical protein